MIFRMAPSTVDVLPIALTLEDHKPALTEDFPMYSALLPMEYGRIALTYRTQGPFRFSALCNRLQATRRDFWFCRQRLTDILPLLLEVLMTQFMRAFNIPQCPNSRLSALSQPSPDLQG